MIEMPVELIDLYNALADKRDAETLTEAEHQELVKVADQIEMAGVKWLELLVRLAESRNITLPQLMADLRIQTPEIR